MLACNRKQALTAFLRADGLNRLEIEIFETMEDKALPKSYGPGSASPVPFSEQDDLCIRLDEFYQSTGIRLKSQPSSFFRGALYAMRYKDNPDWMAQVAHSLREILYRFKKSGGWHSAIVSYGSTYDTGRIGPDVGAYYGFISDVAHHNFEGAEMSPLVGGAKDKPVPLTPELFAGVVLRFSRILFAVLRRQIETHKEIDDILAVGPPGSA